MKFFVYSTAILLVGLGFSYSVSSQVAKKVSQAKSAKAKADQKTKKKDANKSEGEFVRIRRDDAKQPVAFETAIIRYVGKNKKGEPITVDLIGAVHIGEKQYYEALNEEFKKYDSVLYELVAPKGTVVRKGEKRSGFSAVSSLQKSMKDFLELDFQLDHIDYEVKNFVHADMSPEEFSKSMVDNEESMMKVFFKMMGHSIGSQGKKNSISDFDLIGALMAKDRAYKLRSMFAGQLLDIDSADNLFSGKNGSTIITHRNTAAFKVLSEEIEKGKKKIGVFYGAGHFPDMERRLIDEFKLKKKESRWLIAWDLVKSSGKE